MHVACVKEEEYEYACMCCFGVVRKQGWKKNIRLLTRDLWSMAFLVLGAVNFLAIFGHQFSNAFGPVYFSDKINMFSSLMDKKLFISWMALLFCSL